MANNNWLSSLKGGGSFKDLYALRVSQNYVFLFASCACSSFVIFDTERLDIRKLLILKESIPITKGIPKASRFEISRVLLVGRLN